MSSLWFYQTIMIKNILRILKNTFAMFMDIF